MIDRGSDPDWMNSHSEQGPQRGERRFDTKLSQHNLLKMENAKHRKFDIENQGSET